MLFKKALEPYALRDARTVLSKKIILFWIIVIGIVISFVGDALLSLLKNRQNTILLNLQEADKRVVDAEKKLEKARIELELSKLKVKEIQNQSFNTIKKDKIQSTKQTQEVIQRLENLKKQTLIFEYQKTLNVLSKKIIQLSLNQVQTKLKSCADMKFQNSINNFYITLFRHYDSLNSSTNIK